MTLRSTSTWEAGLDTGAQRSSLTTRIARDQRSPQDAESLYCRTLSACIYTSEEAACSWHEFKSRRSCYIVQADRRGSDWGLCGAKVQQTGHRFWHSRGRAAKTILARTRLFCDHLIATSPIPDWFGTQGRASEDNLLLITRQQHLKKLWWSGSPDKFGPTTLFSWVVQHCMWCFLLLLYWTHFLLSNVSKTDSSDDYSWFLRASGGSWHPNLVCNNTWLIWQAELRTTSVLEHVPGEWSSWNYRTKDQCVFYTAWWRTAN